MIQYCIFSFTFSNSKRSLYNEVTEVLPILTNSPIEMQDADRMSCKANICAYIRENAKGKKLQMASRIMTIFNDTLVKYLEPAERAVRGATYVNLS